MKVTNHPEFATAAALLEKMRAEFSRLEAEQAEINRRLRFKEATPITVLSDMERARIVAEGGEIPPSRVDAVSELQDRELEIRERLELLRRALVEQPIVVEHERERARVEALSAAKTERDRIEGLWARAVSAMAAAIAAEDALLDGLVAGGYGRADAAITNGFGWLNREEFKRLNQVAKAA